MPVIMAGILAVYGLVTAVMIANQLSAEQHIFRSFMQLGAGLSVGVCGLAAGFSIGITGDAGVRGSTQQPRLFTGMMLIQILSEVLGESLGVPVGFGKRCGLLTGVIGIYGMIVAVLMLSRASSAGC
jgi:V-type H+-transporting ATPase proteolipid subunit